MNKSLKVKLDDGTLTTYSKFITEDGMEFDSEVEAVLYVKDTNIDLVQEWFDDYSLLSPREMDFISKTFKRIDKETISKLIVLLSNLV